MRQQGEGAELAAKVEIQKVSAMATGFQALGDHRIHALRLQPQRLVQGGGAGEDLRPAAPDSFQQVRLRQAEVEADHRRAKFLHQRGRFGVERQTSGPAGNARRVYAQFVIVGRQRFTPPSLAGRVRLGRHMAEEVEVERPLGQLAHRLQLLAQGGRREHGAGNRAEAAGLAHGGGQAMILRAGHRRLDQGQVSVEQGGERHGMAPFQRGIVVRTPARPTGRPRAMPRYR